MASAGPSTLNAAEEAVTLVVGDSHASLIFQVDVTGTITVTFEATADGSTWVAVQAEDTASAGTQATTATADGLYLIPCAGYAKVRARASSVASGASATVTGRLSTGAPHWG